MERANKQLMNSLFTKQTNKQMHASKGVGRTEIIK